MTFVMEEKRHTQHQGGPAMSRRLRTPVLAWMGSNGLTNRKACEILGIPLGHFTDWLGNDMRILRDDAQDKCLANEGIKAKWAQIEAKGVRL